MDADSSRWHEITPSSFAHERAALQYVRDLLPDRHPYQAWSNFTFLSDQGHIREIDLLVAAPTGLFLIEVKNFKGPLSNSGSMWQLPRRRSERSFDSPLPLADQKAKELRSLLTRAAAKERSVRVPFVGGCIFLAEPQMECALSQDQWHHLYVPDKGRAAGMLRRIGADLLLGPVTHAPPDPEFLRALPRLLQRVGIHRTRRSVMVGPWEIDPRPYDSGPTWQDHRAKRDDLPGAYRRIRVYLYERQADPEARTSVQHAAQREFLAAQGIEHPGLLVPNELLDHEMGPALLIDQHPKAERLDHFMAEEGATLNLPARLELVRQLAEAVGYAHDRRLVHRALSPRAIIVEPGHGGSPAHRVRVGEWQTAARGLSSTSTDHRVAPTTHAGRHVDKVAGAYLAPEFTADVDGTEAIDIFGLGATAYLLLTGKAPAAGRAELVERLAAEGGLHPSVVSDDIPSDLDALIALATAPKVTDRPDVSEFLGELDVAIGKARPEQLDDPWEAQADTELPDGYLVRRALGTGSTARAFLVERDGLESVLKVGRSAQSQERLGDEAIVLEGLRHDNVVGLRRGVFELANRSAIEIDFAGAHTLAHVLREEGVPVPDQLQRFGEQLLASVNYLRRKETFHRDIKPDNLGVRRHPKRGPALILFDFSLAGASDSDVLAGTRGYRDPFLGTDRRPIYDVAAELYAVAVTLHEMASLELPTWGEDGTDPRFVDEVTISSELFETGLRDPLTVFFRRALHRDAERRYPSAGAMRHAWKQVFTAMDEQGPARTSHSMSDDPAEQRDEAAEAATASTALDAAGLSLRAVAVAQRLGASTVGDLVQISTRDLWRARGLSRTTRLELVNRASSWRRSFAESDPDQSSVPDSPDGSLPSLDAITARLIPPPTKKGVDLVALTKLLLGLPGDDGTLPGTRWPTLKQVGEESGLTGARISQIAQRLRAGWADEPMIEAIRVEVAEQLRSLGRVAAAGELVEQLLVSRGCDTEEAPDRRRAFGYAVLRAAVEADAVADTPLFASRRHHERMILALQVTDDESLETPSDAELLAMAVDLADEAARLAGRDPLPTPVAVVRALETVARRHDLVPAEQRLVQLGAAASGSVLANARLELFPSDLDPVRALRLSQAGAGVPADGLTPKALIRRVAARFPGLPALPLDRELERLLREAGFALRWDGERLVPPSTALASSSLQSETSGAAPVVPLGSPESGPGARLAAAVRAGGARLVTFRRSRWARCRRQVAELTGVEPVDASAVFVSALHEVADELRITNFDVVLRADAPDADPRARTNLQRVVDVVWTRLERQWSGTDVLLLDALTPFGRYQGGMTLLGRLLEAGRQAGRDGGPRTVVLLCPAQDEQLAPRIGAQAIGLTTAEEWIIAPSSWTSAVSVA